MLSQLSVTSKQLRPLTVAIVTCATVGALAIGGCSTTSASDSPVEINALWYGKQPSGEIAGGVTPVEITSSRTESGDFSVDMSKMQEAAGPVWTAAAWSASTIGTLGAAKNPTGLTVGYELAEDIDGPSAGALMTTGVLASLTGGTVKTDTTMTGTVLPSGAVGPVGGIPEKIRAAADAGFKRVYIPIGQRQSVDPRTGSSVDVFDLGADLGVDVTEIASVREAYAALVESAQPLPQSAPGPIQQKVLAVQSSATDAAMRELTRESPLAPAPNPALAPVRTQAVAARADAIANTPALIAKGELTAAFQKSTAAVQEVNAWHARAQAVSDAKTSEAKLLESLTKRADEIAAKAHQLSVTSAAKTLSFTEQPAAVSDALTWATDSEIGALVISDRLAAAPVGDLSSAVLGQVAAELSEFDDDLAVYLPTSMDTALASGTTPMADEAPLLANADTYTTFLTNAAEANINYFNTAVSNASSASDQADLLRSQKAAAILKGEQDGSDQAELPPLARLAIAVSYFVASQSLVADLGVVASVADQDSSGARYKVTSQENFNRQVTIAAKEADVDAGALTALNADPSYFQWAQQWSELAASDPQANSGSDQARVDGLNQQWLSIVASKIAIEQVTTAQS